uniref:Uncharacterized protein n=1 Tax=Tetranychus urticae TaxID=32264 RepID=T1KLI9_TETUR
MLINDNHCVQAQVRAQPRCVDVPCSPRTLQQAENYCIGLFRKLNPGIKFAEMRTSTHSCGIGVWTYQCCISMNS